MRMKKQWTAEVDSPFWCSHSYQGDPSLGLVLNVSLDNDPDRGLLVRMPDEVVTWLIRIVAKGWPHLMPND